MPHAGVLRNELDILGKEPELAILVWYTSFCKRKIRTILRWPTFEQLKENLLKELERLMKRESLKNEDHGEANSDVERMKESKEHLKLPPNCTGKGMTEK